VIVIEENVKNKHDLRTSIKTTNLQYTKVYTTWFEGYIIIKRKGQIVTIV